MISKLILLLCSCNLLFSIFLFLYLRNFLIEVRQTLDNKTSIIENIVKSKVGENKFDKYKNTDGLFKIKR